MATTNTDVIYYLDGSNFMEYGVHVSASKGITASLKPKKPVSVVWPDYHGEAVDLESPRYEAREITLECFLSADGKEGFFEASSKFLSAFDKPGTRRLKIVVGELKPLVYEVYCPNAIDMNKKWSSGKMVGTFTLTLTEPEPVKKVLSFTSTEDANKAQITISTAKLVNLYWGDGSHSFDVYGQDLQLSHTYEQAGIYEIILTGVIEDIKDLTTNATILWNKL